MDGIKFAHCDSLCSIRQCALKKGMATRSDCPDLEKCQKVFAEWIDNGYTDDDKNTIIPRVELTDGPLLSHGTRYEF